MKTLRQMTGEVRELNTAKGWRDTSAGETTWGDYVALLHSEAAEMLEAFRDRGTAEYTTATGKPDDVAAEGADCLIRLLDMCDVFDFPVFDMDMDFADVSPFLPADGYPTTFGGWDAWLQGQVAKLYPVVSDTPTIEAKLQAPLVLRAIVGVCERYGVELEAEYERKMAYNWTRPYQHGGRTLTGKETRR